MQKPFASTSAHLLSVLQTALLKKISLKLILGRPETRLGRLETGLGRLKTSLPSVEIILGRPDQQKPIRLETSLCWLGWPESGLCSLGRIKFTMITCTYLTSLPLNLCYRKLLLVLRSASVTAHICTINLEGYYSLKRRYRWKGYFWCDHLFSQQCFISTVIENTSPKLALRMSRVRWALRKITDATTVLCGLVRWGGICSSAYPVNAWKSNQS